MLPRCPGTMEAETGDAEFAAWLGVEKDFRVRPQATSNSRNLTVLPVLP